MNSPQVTPKQRLQHFLASIEDYERLEATFPLPTSLLMTGHQDDEVSRWTVITHAMILRKYFAPRDKLNVKRVARALRQSVVDPQMRDDDWEMLEKNIGLVDAIVEFNIGDQKLDENEILEIMLYGRYLHGDYAKWAKEPYEGARDSAAFWAVNALSQRVIKLGQLVKVAIKDGVLVLDGN